MVVLTQLHIQDQVLKYLQDRKSARTQPTTHNPAGIHCILPTAGTESIPSVTINISFQKNVTIKILDDIPGMPFCLHQTADIDHPVGMQFVLPTTITTTKSRTFTAVNFAIREPGRPPGKHNHFPPSSQPCTLHKVSNNNETDSYGIVC